MLRHLRQSQLAKQYAVEASRLHKTSMLAEQTQMLTPSERAKWVLMPQIVAKARQLACHVQRNPLDIKANLQHLLLSMYILQPPLRREYADMPVLAKAPTNPEQYCVLRSAPVVHAVVVNKDKISRHAGPGNFKLTAALGITRQ